MDKGKNNYTWCWQCENWKEVLGHSEINCPNVVCRNCGLVGHIRQECPDSLHPKTRNITPSGNCNLVEHSESECPYPTVRIVGIVTPRCEFCYGGHEMENCSRKPIHDLLNKYNKYKKAKKLTKKKAKIDKKVDLEVRVIGMSTRNGPLVNPEY